MEHHKAFGPAGPVFLPCLLRRAHGRECRGRLRSSGVGERAEGVGRGCPRSAGRLHGGPTTGEEGIGFDLMELFLANCVF